MAQQRPAGTYAMDGSDSIVPSVAVTDSVAANSAALASSPALPDLTTSVEAGRVYALSCSLFVRCDSSTAGFRMDFGGGTATATSARLGWLLTDTQVRYVTVTTAFGTAAATATCGATTGIYGNMTVTGSVEVATSGTIAPRFARNSEAGLPAAISKRTGLAVAKTNSSVVYAQTGSTSTGAFYRSTDSGWTWTFLGNFTTGGAIAAHPTTPGTVYSGMSGGTLSAGYLHKSTDYGATWAAAANLTVIPGALAFDPTDATKMYAGSSTYVYRSTDSGATWAASSTNVGAVTTLAVDPVAPSILYATNSGTANGVYKSTDSGATWALANTGLSLSTGAVVMIDPAVNTTLYAGGATAAAVYKSTDSGGTWALSNSGIPSTSTTDMAYDTSTSPATLYAGHGASTFVSKSTDSGATWTAAYSGLSDSGVTGFAVANDGIVFVTQGTAGLNSRSADRGGTWIKMTGTPVTLEKGSSCTWTTVR